MGSLWRLLEYGCQEEWALARVLRLQSGRTGIRDGERGLKQAKPIWIKAQAKSSIVGVETGCLCLLHEKRP